MTALTQAQTLVGHWTFETGSELVDLTGNFSNPLTLHGATVSGGALDVTSNYANTSGYTGPTITEKTLVSWVRLDNLDVRAGSALTIDQTDNDQFDGIVYAERQQRRWMPGSTAFHRTEDPNPGFYETTTGNLVVLAITYENIAGTARIKIYRNGFLIGGYDKGAIKSWSGSNTEIVFGARHTNPGAIGALDAHIEEARIYDGVLTQSEIQALVAGWPDTDSPVLTTNTFTDAGTLTFDGTYTDTFSGIAAIEVLQSNNMSFRINGQTANPPATGLPAGTVIINATPTGADARVVYKITDGAGNVKTVALDDR